MQGVAAKNDASYDLSRARGVGWGCRTCAWSWQALAWEELRCLAGQPFSLRLHRLAPAGVAPAAL